ncbi:MAG: diphthamide synthesis protein [Nanoarchaeota archaeon]
MYKLELDKLINEIKKQKYKKILIQLPDGMKNKANIVADSIEENTDAKAFIWFGDCYGACDLPSGMDILNIDLIVQWGHNKFNKEMW